MTRIGLASDLEQGLLLLQVTFFFRDGFLSKIDIIIKTLLSPLSANRQ